MRRTLSRRLNRLESNPDNIRRLLFSRLNILDDPQALQKELEALTDDELLAYIDSLETEGFVGIDWEAVPAVALDAFMDGDITVEELQARYPAKKEAV